jgi:hypothetical protein
MLRLLMMRRKSMRRCKQLGFAESSGDEGELLDTRRLLGVPFEMGFDFSARLRREDSLSDCRQ